MSSRIEPWSRRLTLAAVCSALAAVQLYAFHWGVITPDTVVQYEQALSGRYDDWHPPITAALWRQLLHLGSGGAPFLLLDLALYWTALGLVADRLRRSAHPLAALLPIAIGLFPVTFGQMGAILKDPLMAALVLMATALLILGEDAGRRWLAILAVPVLLLAAATRFNALFAAWPLLICAMPASWTRNTRGLWAVGLGAGALLVVTPWMINDVALRPTHSHPFHSLVNFDLAGIVAQGGTNGYPMLGDKQVRALVAHCYDPRLFGQKDEAGCAETEDAIAAYVAQRDESALGLWLNAVLTSPAAWARHRLAHVNWNWRFAIPTVPGDAVYMMSAPNARGLHFAPNALTLGVVEAAGMVARSPIGRPATWLALAFGLLFAAAGSRHQRIIQALAASALFYGGAYALVSVAPDLRYNLWTMLATMLALALLIAERPALSPLRWIVLAGPAVGAAIVEIAALT